MLQGHCSGPLRSIALFTYHERVPSLFGTPNRVYEPLPWIGQKVARRPGALGLRDDPFSDKNTVDNVDDSISIYDSPATASHRPGIVRNR